MSILGQFSASVGAMMAQSKRMEAIGLNVANLNTGGYKRNETHFSTIVSQSYGYNRDIGGVKAYTRNLIDQQGSIISSDSNFDVAINGGGFFVLNTEVDGSGDVLYGRDGMMQQRLGGESTITENGNTITIREGYLVDKNGYFIQGWPINSDMETFPTDAGSLQSLRIDPDAFTLEPEATTEASIWINIPGEAPSGYSESTFIKAYDANGDLQTYEMRWTNLILGSGTSSATPEWNLPSANAIGYSEDNSITVNNSDGFTDEVTLRWSKTAADTWDLRAFRGSQEVDIDGTDDGTYTPVSVTFDPLTGAIVTPTSVDIPGSGSTEANFTLDLASMTQNNTGATITQTNFTHDGVSTDSDQNNWTLEVFHGSNALAIDTDDTATRLQVTFGGDGKIISPTSISIPEDGDGPAFTVDMTRVTQFDDDRIIEYDYTNNGHSDAKLDSFSINIQGEILGRFSDATQRPIYKLPLATFTNPNALDLANGNVYRATEPAGELVIRVAGGQGAGVFTPNSREISNVVLEDEFSKMIITQNAYNTASTVIKTVDEMTEVARDLK